MSEFERRISANGKTIKESVFSAVASQDGTNRNTKFAQGEGGQKRGFKGKRYHCGKVGHRRADRRKLVVLFGDVDGCTVVGNDVIEFWVAILAI